MNILAAMNDPKLFRKTFQPKKGLFRKGPGIDSWRSWRVFLATLFGLPMDADALEIYKKHTGREDVATVAYREAYLVAGRRSGKSIIASLVAVFVATLRDYREFLAPGEQGVVMVLAADRKQARTIFNYISAFLDSPLLRTLVVSKRKESIDLSTGIRIEVHTSNYRSVRGVTLIAAICDELAFWQDENSANPDTEVLNALRPACATIPNALLLGISSPYARRGQLFNAYKEHFGKQSDVLVWQGASLDMNPTLPASVVESAYRKDPSSAQAEYGAQFRTDVETFISLETVESAIISGRKELPYDESKVYYAFCDPSGGVSDSFCMAIAHCERGERAILDLVREIQAPLSPKLAAAEFAAIFRAFHIFECEGDQYGAAWVSEEFAKCGVTYKPSEKNKNQIYLEFLPGLMSHQCELLDHPRLIAQLISLERKTGRLHDSIDHPQGSHDDLANAACGALVMVLAWNVTGRLGLLDLVKDIERGARALPVSVDEHLAIVKRVDNYAIQKVEKAKPKCPICQKTENVIQAPVAGGWLCNQCSATFTIEGELTSRPQNSLIIGVNCCPHPLRQVIGHEFKCGNCDRQSGRDPREPEPRGVTRQQYAQGLGRSRGQFALGVALGKNRFGRFG
jgi:hypothetical protein